MSNKESKKILFERWSQLGDKNAMSQGQKYIYVTEEYDWIPESEMLKESDLRINNTDNLVSLNSDENYEYDNELQAEIPVTKRDRISKHYFSDIPFEIEFEPKLNVNSSESNETIEAVIDDENEPNEDDLNIELNEPIDFDPSMPTTDWRI